MEPSPNPSARLELWGGVECTVNRVGEAYFDQLSLSGHATRSSDLDRIAALGIRVLRYPVLWERTAPDSLDDCHWQWADERLAKLRTLGIEPIVGLVHHGSGPRYTSLLDPEFPRKLAAYAEKVARRFPWVTAYTPVNEPLTTARFSALYGHWYPHAQDTRAFTKALVHQLYGTVLAMEAIRQVNPAARLVQTEDLGKTYSTAELSYQAEFENHRRWLTWDLLCGRLDARHPLWKFLLKSGLTEGELAYFIDHPCPPDVIGINHYVTSCRFLDHRLELYPKHLHGGNGKHRYVDVEAVRILEEEAVRPRLFFEDTWKRYGRPIAVTEAHLGCTREEQVRWVRDIWHECENLKDAGVEILAATAWSLFGSFGWNSLVTRLDGSYESGAFCVRGPKPRATAVAGLLRSLAHGETVDIPALDSPGWWRRPARFLHSLTLKEGALLAAPVDRPAPRPPRPLLIIGATGTLGRAFGRICELRGLEYRLVGRREIDIACPEHVRGCLEGLSPWAVVNAAGYVRVDEAERDEVRCFRENAIGAGVLASECAKRGIRLLTFSSDMVFDGLRNAPYSESVPVSPLNVYGRSKAEAERQVLSLHPKALVVRTSAFFGPWDEYNFVTLTLKRLLNRQPVVASDHVVSPTYVPHLVHASLDLLLDAEEGVWHLSNSGAVSWSELAVTLGEMVGAGRSLVRSVSLQEEGLKAPRPKFSALISERGMLLPSWQKALSDYQFEREGETLRVAS
jgi:dTDP-4-dehydrorhamnose reductase